MCFWGVSPVLEHIVDRIVTDTAAKRKSEPDRMPIHSESDVYK